MAKQQKEAITSQSALTSSAGKNIWVATPRANAPETAVMARIIFDIFMIEASCSASYGSLFLNRLTVRSSELTPLTHSEVSTFRKMVVRGGYEINRIQQILNHYPEN